MSEPVPEFSRRVEITKVHQPHKLKANEAELLAIAKRLKLPELTKLEAEVSIKRGRGDTILVTGELFASLSQTCVVTLEPFPVEVNELIDATYTDGEPPPLNEVLTLAEDDPDAPEPVINGKIDLGELVVQSLSLGLDPYPRKPGVEFQGYDK